MVGETYVVVGFGLSAPFEEGWLWCCRACLERKNMDGGESNEAVKVSDALI
jgi:hypothetical protein